jgi:hypothetical protein
LHNLSHADGVFTSWWPSITNALTHAFDFWQLRLNKTAQDTCSWAYLLFICNEFSFC